MSDKNKQIIHFEKGIPGFPECQNFIMTDLKTGFYDPLKLLISTEQPGLSFILYPHGNKEPLFSPAGAQEIQEHFTADLDVYTIVTVKEPNGHFALSTNLRAPVLVDRRSHKGWQYILSDKENPIEFPLESLSRELRQKRESAGVS